jgi:polysaccharide biosynthesis/export protein
MHNPITRSDKTIARFAAAAIAAALLMFAQQPAAFAQASSSQSNAQGQGSGTEPRLSPGGTLQNSLTTVPEDFATLKLAPGFQINVQVYGEPDFSGHARVDNEGNISIAFLKSVHVAGDTIAEAQAEIAKKFQEQGILKNPQVTIDVEQFATTSATVLGEVNYPGRVELLTQHSLLEVIGLSGGETALAGNEVELKHADAKNGNSTRTFHYSRGSNGDAIRDVMVQPGDTVIVKRAGLIYVLGAVNRPGGYPMQEDGELNVAQAISLAQGLALQAKVGALRVVEHGADGKPLDVPVSYKRIMDGKDVPMNLAEGDIVYVPISKAKAMFTASASLIGQTTAATIYAVH